MKKHSEFRIKRIASGIPGLDEIIQGGIPEKDLILLSGMSGAGKTVFGLQFAVSEAMKTPAIYVSFEEELDKIKATAKNFHWNIDKLESHEKIRFLKYDPFKIEDIFEVIENNIREVHAQRVVIDSISSIGIYVRDPPELRRMILQISNILRKNNCTSILISEVVRQNAFSRFGVEEFVTDGVILLRNILVGEEYRRGLTVWKMRATNHSKRIHPYKITDYGFNLFPKDTMMLK